MLNYTYQRWVSLTHGSAANNGQNSNTPKQTISQVTSACPNNTTVYVDYGAYTETITIQANIQILSIIGIGPGLLLNKVVLTKPLSVDNCFRLQMQNVNFTQTTQTPHITIGTNTYFTIFKGIGITGVAPIAIQLPYATIFTNPASPGPVLTLQDCDLTTMIGEINCPSMTNTYGLIYILNCAGTYNNGLTVRLGTGWFVFYTLSSNINFIFQGNTTAEQNTLVVEQNILQNKYLTPIDNKITQLQQQDEQLLTLLSTQAQDIDNLEQNIAAVNQNIQALTETTVELRALINDAVNPQLEDLEARLRRLEANISCQTI